MPSKIVPSHDLGDGRHYESRVGHGLQRHPPDAVRKVLEALGRRLQGQPRLARAPRSGEGEEAYVPASEQPEHLGELALTAEERRRLDRKVRPVERLQGREVAVTELVEALRRGEILQPVQSLVAELGALVEARRGLGDEDLPAVAGCADPRAPVDVHADVALVGDDRLTGVDAHPDADRAGGERSLGCSGGGDCPFRGREGDEEGVPLRVDLDAAVARERFPQHPPMLAEEVRVPLAVLAQQPGRALDIREEEGDRAARELAHGGCR